MRKTNIPTKEVFFARKIFFLSIYCNCSCWGIQYFFRCKDFSVRLLARFHFMNKHVYLAVLIFCSCRSRRYGREQLFVPLRFTQTPQTKCKSIILSIQYFFPAPEMFEYSVHHCLRRSAKVFKFVYFRIGGCLMIKKHSEFRVKVCIHPYFAAKLSEPFS